MLNLTSIIRLAKDPNLTQQVNWKLVRQNEPAAKLAEGLEALAITASALDDKTACYLSPFFAQAEFIDVSRII